MNTIFNANKPQHDRSFLKIWRYKALSLILCMLVSFQMVAQSTKNNSIDMDLIDKYIKSLGYTSYITFDATNIKQYWIDKSVISKNNNIIVSLLNNKQLLHESTPLKIQLVNLSESQVCKIDVISYEQDFSFSVEDEYSKQISLSTSNTFVQHKVESSTFELNGATEFSFFLKFSSKKATSLSIQKIILSFYEKKQSNYLESPGYLKITPKDISDSNLIETLNEDFVVTGKRNYIIADRNILVSNNNLSSSIKVKNIGVQPTRLYFGYAPFSKDNKRIDYRHYPYPYTENKTLRVISFQENSDRIIVDSYPKWEPKCSLGLGAKDDLSDIPNLNILDATILKVNKLENGFAEIIFNKKITQKIEEGAQVRIQQPPGNNNIYVYVKTQTLQPGEEALITGTIKKDNNSIQYPSKLFTRGVYYVKPLILSFSVNSQEDNSIQIIDFSVAY